METGEISFFLLTNAVQRFSQLTATRMMLAWTPIHYRYKQDQKNSSWTSQELFDMQWEILELNQAGHTLVSILWNSFQVWLHVAATVEAFCNYKSVIRPTQSWGYLPNYTCFVASTFHFSFSVEFVWPCDETYKKRHKCLGPACHTLIENITLPMVTKCFNLTTTPCRGVDPEFYHLWNHHHLDLFITAASEDKVNWTQASEWCKLAGGHLPVFGSKDDMKKMFLLLYTCDTVCVSLNIIAVGLQSSVRIFCILFHSLSMRTEWN